MTPAQRRQSQQNLRALEDQLLHRGPSTLAPSSSEAGEPERDDDAKPLAEMLQTIASNRNANNTQLLGRVNRALEKLRDEPKNYGLCEECGEEIAWGRLRAMPFAEYCVTCQAQKDGPRGPATRRHLTDFR
jgi:DnaK suppressor protein